MGGLFGGGGGGGSQPAPVTQQVNNTSIPAYAQPYVESMLGQAQALTDINQNPYQAYGGERIAAFTPMQAQAFQNTANLTPASQLGTGSDLSTVSGIGSIGTGMQMGNAGNQYQRQATSMSGPGSIGSYMNPYLSQSLAPQLNLLAQQYGIQGASQQGAATQAGAFGGSRNALAQGLNQQNQLMAQQQAIAQGYNTAYQNAQQAQQFGANLGLQGLTGQLAGFNQANQAASTLGQLGQTQYGQQMGINQAQQQAGAVQQAQAQQGLDTSYQDFLRQKNYPYTQLAFMSDMTRGIPLSQSAQSIYQAPPNLGSQLGGLGMTALGIYGMSGAAKAKGGQIKGMKAGGMAYASGGDIKMMDTKQLTELLNNPNLTPIEVSAVQEELMLRQRMENNPEAGKIMGVPQGIDSIPTGDMVPEEGMAGGGIIAFAKGAAVDSGDDTDWKAYQKMLFEDIKKRQAKMNESDPFTEAKARESKIQAQIDESKRVAPYQALAQTGLATMAGTSPYLARNIGLGGLEGMKNYAQSTAEQDSLNKMLMQQASDREKSQYSRDTSALERSQTTLGQLFGREIGMEQARATRANAGASSGTNALIKAQNSWNQILNDTKTTLLKQQKFSSLFRKDPDAFNRAAEAEARKNTSPDVLNILGFKAPAPDVSSNVGGGGGKAPPPPKGFIPG